jgi:hypothetical protein
VQTSPDLHGKTKNGKAKNAEPAEGSGDRESLRSGSALKIILDYTFALKGAAPIPSAGPEPRWFQLRNSYCAYQCSELPETGDVCLSER